MPLSEKTPSICFVSLLSYRFFNSSKSKPADVGYQGLSTVAKSLRSSFNVSVVTEDCGQPEKQLVHGITLYASIDVKSKNFLKNLYRFFKALHQSNSDIYVASVFGKDVFFTWLFCSLYRKKFVYLTAHDNECNDKNKKQHPVASFLFYIALQRADAIIVILENHTNLLQTYHPYITCPIIHIPYGMTHEEQSLPDKTYALWIARCDPIKNPLLYIDLAKDFPQQPFLMIAAPQENFLSLFHEVQSEASKYSNITFIAGVPNNEAQHYFNAAKVSINTSDAEGFPFAFIESGIAKTPILSLNVNPDESITKYDIGYYADKDMNVLRKQLQNILTNPHDWHQKSENISAYVKKYNNIEHTSLQWQKVLKEIWSGA